MMTKGQTLCNATVATQSVLELVYTALITNHALMGLSTLSASGFKMALGGVRKEQIYISICSLQFVSCQESHQSSVLLLLVYDVWWHLLIAKFLLNVRLCC